eukprot:975945-Heterocapsa_arctica.AAC.1
MLTAPATRDGRPLPSAQEGHGRTDSLGGSTPWKGQYEWRDRATGRVPWQSNSVNHGYCVNSNDCEPYAGPPLKSD